MSKSSRFIKIISMILALMFFLAEFLIMPRMSSKPDMSAFEGVTFAHRGYFDNESAAPENSLASFEKSPREIDFFTVLNPT